MTHGRAKVERSLASVAAFTGQTYRKLSGQWMKGHPETRHLLTGGMHEVHVLGQGLAQRTGHRFNPTVRHEPSSDLSLDLLLQPIDPRLILVPGKTILEG